MYVTKFNQINFTDYEWGYELNGNELEQHPITSF